MSQRKSANITGVGLAVGAAVAFGTLAILAKFGYRAGASPAGLLATRFTTAAVLLALFRLVQSRKNRPRRDQVVKLLLLGGVAYATESMLFFAALENASAAVVTLVFYSFPLWTSLLAISLRLEPFRPQLFIALGLAGTGIVVIFSAPLSGSKGPVLALAAALAVALYYVAFQVVARDVDSGAAALWTSAGAAVGTGSSWLFLEHDLPKSAVPIGLALGLASAVAFSLLYAAIARIGSSRAAIANMMEPVATVAFAAIFLGESITWRVATGAALVVSALPVLALTTRPHPEIPAP